MQASYFYSAHFMASVAFSGFAAPKLFISLKRSYMSSEVITIPLSTIHYDTVSDAQVQVCKCCRTMLRFEDVSLFNSHLEYCLEQRWQRFSIVTAFKSIYLGDIRLRFALYWLWPIASQFLSRFISLSAPRSSQVQGIMRIMRMMVEMWTWTSCQRYLFTVMMSS